MPLGSEKTSLRKIIYIIQIAIPKKRAGYERATACSEVQETKLEYKRQVETCGIGFFRNYSHNRREVSYAVLDIHSKKQLIAS